MCLLHLHESEDMAAAKKQSAKRQSGKTRKPRYRTLLNEDGERGPFRVFLIHGPSEDWIKVRDFIRNRLRFDVVVSVDDFRGAPIMEKVRNTIWRECDCAVAILSDDVRHRDETTSASPNALLEIGYCMGFFDYRYWEDTEMEPVLLIKHEDVSLPTDLHGFEYISYSPGRGSGIRAAFPVLRRGLERLYDQTKTYFKDDEGE